MSKIKTLSKIASTYFKQFASVDSIRFLFLHVVNYLYDHDLVPSYSQTGEDRIINSIIDIYGKWEKADFSSQYYVEVGCNEPAKYSNTFEFYKQGWHGICIDANEGLIKKFQQSRPRDTRVSALISSIDNRHLQDLQVFHSKPFRSVLIK